MKLNKILVIGIVLSFISFSNDENNIKIRYSATLDGKVLIDENSDLIHPIASLTKVMNVLVTLDQVKKYNISLNSEIKFDKDSIFIKGSSIDTYFNKYTLEDLIKSQLVFSANNAAYAVAKYIGRGSIDNFINLMNKKARELNMKNTYYGSPSGLPPRLSNGYNLDLSTAKDQYLLTKYVILNTNILEYSSLSSISFINTKGNSRLYLNRNKLINNKEVFGLKTGFHNDAGYNMILVAKIGDSYVISISMNDISDNDRTIIQNSMLDYAKSKLKKIVDKDKTYYLLDVYNHKFKQVEGYIKKRCRINFR